ncbi:quinone oxidoreductase [Nonomuraea sp. NPDC046570]|uniref:quinone oxidoreductase family protein n=1 Tax=Nonomuraea sp. NPDC046570 TaxID=3155255 RepID=UPI0033DB80F6
MRAILVRSHGGPEVLRAAEVPDPEPGPGEAVVDVETAGVNFIDVHHRSGRYPVPLPFVPGQEGAGTVREVGPGVTEVEAGRRVGWVNVPGAYAERALIPADRLVPLPDGISTRTAAAVLLQGMTAHYLVDDTCRVRPGDTVLVHAAAGGMGLLLTQLVKLRGGQVIGTVSTPEKEKAAREAGADHVIRYTEQEVAPAVREITSGAGVAAVLDGIGAPTFDVGLASLRPRGVLALYGQAAGPVPPLDLQRLNSGGSLFVTRPNLDHHIASRDELQARARDVLAWVLDGRLRVRVDGVRPLNEAAIVHNRLEQRRSIGKLLISCSEDRLGCGASEPI